MSFSIEHLDDESRRIIERFKELQHVALLIMINRQQKYGPHNISRAGFGGVLVRLGDKLARLQRGTQDHADESVKDTLFDTANYALIAAMVHEGTWPQPPIETKEQQRARLLEEIDMLCIKLKHLDES